MLLSASPFEPWKNIAALTWLEWLSFVDGRLQATTALQKLAQPHPPKTIKNQWAGGGLQSHALKTGCLARNNQRHIEATSSLAPCPCVQSLNLCNLEATASRTYHRSKASPEDNRPTERINQKKTGPSQLPTTRVCIYIYTHIHNCIYGGNDPFIWLLVSPLAIVCKGPFDQPSHVHIYIYIYTPFDQHPYSYIYIYTIHLQYVLYKHMYIPHFPSFPVAPETLCRAPPAPRGCGRPGRSRPGPAPPKWDCMAISQVSEASSSKMNLEKRWEKTKTQTSSKR